jgi:hypothetical protein
MSGEVIQFKDLQVAPRGEDLDYIFFNKRFANIVNAINGVAARQDTFDKTEATLVQVGLTRINDVLGPLLTVLEEAAQIGFLVAEASGPPVSLVVGIDTQFTVTSDGKSLFTPTPYILAIDILDSTNWGVLSLNAYSGTTGVFAGHCVFCTKTQSSTQWSLSCNSALPSAMADLLTQAQTAANAAVAAETSVSGQIGDLESLIAAVQSGPVASVAGKTGVVILQLADVVGLSDALAARVLTTTFNTQLNGKQPISSLLTTFAGLGGATDRLPYFTGVGAMTLATYTAFARALDACADAASVRTALGLGDAAVHPASDFATPASVATAVAPYQTADQVNTAITNALSSALIASSQIGAMFDDQTGTNYTFAPSDNGRAVTITNASAINAILPNNIAKGWNAIVWQGGTGQISFAPATGAALRNRQGQSKTAGQYAMVSIMCMSNTTGTNAVFVLGGDTA